MRTEEETIRAARERAEASNRRSHKMRKSTLRALDAMHRLRHGDSDGMTAEAVHRLRTRIALDVARNPYAWPGGYVRGLIMDDGGIICPRCVRENIRLIAEDTRSGWERTGWAAVDTFHAGETDDHHDTCSHCDREMVQWD